MGDGSINYRCPGRSTGGTESRYGSLAATKEFLIGRADGRGVYLAESKHTNFSDSACEHYSNARIKQTSPDSKSSYVLSPFVCWKSAALGTDSS